MRALLQRLRNLLHPLYYMRKFSAGRWLIRLADKPAWLSIPGVRFRVRGRLVTHGLAFSAAGSNEPAAEALALSCFECLGLKSFWDVGANIGSYTWLMKSSFPFLSAVLIEASPLNAALISETLKRNDLSGVELIVAGASDSAGSGVLRLDSEAGATSTLDGNAEQTFEEEHWGVSSKRIAVPLVTIDEERSSRSSIDFLKVDVEGHEAAVLRGAQKTISSDQPIILVECFHEGHACLKPLQDLGYRFVDGDRLTVDPQSLTSNYFGFPARFHESIGTILRSASERIKAE
jgi:FkbM family methyltransferase